MNMFEDMGELFHSSSVITVLQELHLEPVVLLNFCWTGSMIHLEIIEIVIVQIGWGRGGIRFILWIPGRVACEASLQ